MKIVKNKEFKRNFQFKSSTYMSKFIRAANCHFQHLLVGKSEEVMEK